LLRPRENQEKAEAPLESPSNARLHPWVIVAAGVHFRGGMDKANAALASYLLAAGTPVHIVAHDVDPLFLEGRAARVHLVPRPAGSFAIGEFLLERRGLRVAREVVMQSPETRVVVNGGNCAWPDVNWVHYVHSAWTDIDPAAPLWFKLKHRTFSAGWRRRERVALRAARVVVANSDQTRTHLMGHLKLPPQRIKTVYLGADRSWGEVSTDERAAARRWLAIPDTRPVVAFVGGLGFDGRKGVDTLWAAWLELCADPGWDADLVVAGGGRALERIVRAVERAGMSQRFRVLGPTDRVRDVLASADLLVSPVRYEPYGLNVHEAICRGIPALISGCAGIAERYPADLADMLLGDPTSVGELVDRLRLWRSHIDSWKRRIGPLGQMLRAYSWDDMARSFVDAVECRPPERNVTSVTEAVGAAL